ncbi:hypothetical protein E1A91_A08G098700v1, partial [Gossypium mustelinum]
SLGEEKQATFTYLPSISIGDIAIERVPNADGDEGYRLLVDTEPTSLVEQRNESKVTEGFANLDSSFFEACFSLPLSPFLPSKIGHMEYSEVLRHQFLVPACKGSNPFTPDYEHPIGSVKNELMAIGEATDCTFCLTTCSVNQSLVDLIGPQTRESPAHEECMVPWRFMGRALTVPLPLI